MSIGQATISFCPSDFCSQIGLCCKKTVNHHCVIDTEFPCYGAKTGTVPRKSIFQLNSYSFLNVLIEWLFHWSSKQETIYKCSVDPTNHKISTWIPGAYEFIYVNRQLCELAQVTFCRIRGLQGPFWPPRALFLRPSTALRKLLVKIGGANN